MSSDKDRLRKALDSMIYLPHLKDRQARSTVAALLPGEEAPGGAAAAGGGRPWDRGDLFHRLHTFRAGTWFAKPAAIGAVECARRGWRNTGVDLLSCETCKAAVSCPIAPQLLPPESQRAAERYARQLAEAHEAACPWRTAACSLSLLQFPELPRVAVLLDFNDRAAALQRLLCLPPISRGTLAELEEGGGRRRLERLLRHGPQQQQQQQQQRMVSSASGGDADAADIGAALCDGTAACDSEGFKMRLRLLALCGWDLRVMSTSTATAAGAGASPGGARGDLPAHVGPESAALCCTLCGARAGLWASFPRLEAEVHVAPVAAAAGGHGGSVRTPGLAHSLSRNVAVDMSTTIAGGSMQGQGGGASAAGAGPFGAAQPPAGRDLFGATSTDPPPATPPPAPAPSPAPFGSAGPAGGGRGEGGPPVFGFAALRAGEQGGSGGGSGGGKRKRDAFWESILGADAAAGAEKRAKAPQQGAADSAAAAAAATGSRTPMPAPAAAAQYPSALVLQRCRAMASLPLHPLALHRSFWPLAHSPQVGGDEGGECGWRWCLKQLVPGEEGAAAGPLAAAGDEDGEERAAAWDPAALLRSALSKVEVKK